MPNRGEIWLADLDPRRGTEPGKTRPVLVVQSQALLDADHPSTLVVPLTTKLVDDPTKIRVFRISGGKVIAHELDKNKVIATLACDNNHNIEVTVDPVPTS